MPQVIPVPKPPADAYNPKRRASQLLKDQVCHLEWAVRHANERQPKDFSKIKPPKTEAEAAARIAALTKQLHPEAAKPRRRRAKRSKPRAAKRTGTARTRRATRRAGKKR